MRTYDEVHGKLVLELEDSLMYLGAVENVLENHDGEVDLTENYNQILFGAIDSHKKTVKRLKAEIEYLEENNAEYFI